MSKFTAINTPDHRLRMMGFSNPNSTLPTVYVHSNGDCCERINGIYGLGWYWHKQYEYSEYRCSKRSIVELMERSGRYAQGGKI